MDNTQLVLITFIVLVAVVILLGSVVLIGNRTPSPPNVQVSCYSGATYDAPGTISPRKGAAFTRPMVTIGRRSSCDITLAETAASRLHAIIEYRHGRFFLVDQDSRFGTFIHGSNRAIPRNTPVPLHLNDRFRIAGSWFVLLEKGARLPPAELIATSDEIDQPPKDTGMETRAE